MNPTRHEVERILGVGYTSKPCDTLNKQAAAIMALLLAEHDAACGYCKYRFGGHHIGTGRCPRGKELELR